MTIWYGLRSTMIRSRVDYLSVLKRSNGSNLYLINEADISKLPPSHIPVQVTLEYQDVVDIPILCQELKGKINEFLVAPGTAVSIVDDVRSDVIETFENLGGKCIFTATFSDGNPITTDIETVEKLQEFINDLEDPPEDQHQSSCILYNEAPVLTLPIPIKVSLLLAEYIAKNCYIFASIFNQWLLPYANRIGYRCISVDTEISTVILPYWDEDDILNYNEILLLLFNEDLNTISTQLNWSPGYIQLSDGKWYSLFPRVREELDLNYDLSISSSNIEEWKLKNLQRVSNQIQQGLLPFNKKYPDVRYDDGNKRISIVEVDGIFSVTLLPDNYMIGLYPNTIERKRLEDTFIELWNAGEMLTNYGHFLYLNSYDPIDNNNVVFIGRNLKL